MPALGIKMSAPPKLATAAPRLGDALQRRDAHGTTGPRPPRPEELPRPARATSTMTIRARSRQTAPTAARARARLRCFAAGAALVAATRRPRVHGTGATARS